MCVPAAAPEEALAGPQAPRRPLPAHRGRVPRTVQLAQVVVHLHMVVVKERFALICPTSTLVAYSSSLSLGRRTPPTMMVLASSLRSHLALLLAVGQSWVGRRGAGLTSPQVALNM